MRKHGLKVISVLAVFVVSLYVIMNFKLIADSDHVPSERKAPLENKEDNTIANKLDQVLKDKDFNGTALVVEGDNVILHKGYGYSDMEKQTAATEKTKYRIGSITKMVVAVSILQLQEQGKLNINENVHQYIPSFPADKNITLEHLLTHTSGIKKGGVGKVDSANHLELVTWIGGQELFAIPGKRWKYNDYNYMVLAYVVETITGQSIEQYVTEHVFKPAGMNDSGLGEKKAGDTFLSKGYIVKNDSFQLAPRLGMSWLYGSGDMYTTVEDMKKLDEAIGNGTLLSKETLEKAINLPSPMKYTMGFYIRPGFNHNHGVLIGWNTFNNFNWEKQRYVILFSNIKTGLGDTFNEKFRDLVNTLLDEKNNKKTR